MKESIYLALDFPNWQEANSFIEDNHLQGVPVKVGMELYYREGPRIIERLKQNNHKIFLDLKLHDIPTTVMRTMSVLSSLEVDMVNIHALGGSEMIQRAREGLLNGNPNFDTKLIAVTVLTSMDEQVLNNEMGIPGNLLETTVKLSSFAQKAGVDGVVCSTHEVNRVKAICGEDFITVTPGIRLVDSNVNDQKRVATPSIARKNGADYLVIGRSITQAENPKKAYEQALVEWEESTCN
ncbi:orotidine-5'-phosphate decarboxylase [Paucisalibacillus globulus]|jgi:orotidine-5'-phosphate decarboxylase|uniref:orotidine-5'-phosphate decarboxylase n=1 Tax=Paucisalibacillus globulus TaxID=351095 RepID=UPI000BB97061|nr:orotidine-5'-phosphate decarboxylase [Paucisalibacillus globulus]